MLSQRFRIDIYHSSLTAYFTFVISECNPEYICRICIGPNGLTRSWAEALVAWLNGAQSVCSEADSKDIQRNQVRPRAELPNGHCYWYTGR